MSDPWANSRSAAAQTSSSGPISGDERKVAFDQFVFDPVRQELGGADGTKIPLAPKALALLRYLLANPGRVLAKDELIQMLWGAVVVTDDSLVQCVKDLRTALVDKDQQLIKTLPRRGYMFDVEVRHFEPAPMPSPAPARPATAHSQFWAWLGVAVLLIGALAGAAAWRGKSAVSIDIDEQIRQRRSVAVLAFDDVRGRASGAGLANDLADAIASQLVRSGVRVIGRAATVRQDPASPEFERIGREQGVRYVLGGRIMRVDGKTAVDTYLTEIASGAVYRLHEAQFAADDEALRPRYAQEVLIALQARYYDIETTRARAPGHDKNPVDRIALAWRNLDRGNSEADLKTAQDHFQAAHGADPDSVEALLGLGWSYLTEFHSYYSRSPGRTLDQAEQLLRRALELAPEDPRVLSAWAEVLLLRGRPDEALWLWQRALEIAPENPSVHLRLAAALIKQGRYDEAEARLAQVNDLRPYQLRRRQLLNQTLAEAAFAQGRDDDAYRILTHWVAEFPNNGRPYLMLAAIDALYWRDSSAAAHMAKLRSMLPRASIAYVLQGYPSSNPQFLAQRARLADGLRLAGLPESSK